jgi:hypothetical protein
MHRASEEQEGLDAVSDAVLPVEGCPGLRTGIEAGLRLSVLTSGTMHRLPARSSRQTKPWLIQVPAALTKKHCACCAPELGECAFEMFQLCLNSEFVQAFGSGGRAVLRLVNLRSLSFSRGPDDGSAGGDGAALARVDSMGGLLARYEHPASLLRCSRPAHTPSTKRQETCSFGTLHFPATLND